MYHWCALLENTRSRTEHLQEIIDAKLPLPAVNQCPYNPHLYTAQAELLAMCKKHDIIFNSYSPLGIPDFHKYLGQEHSLVQDPKLLPLAKKHGLSPAQILLAWQAGIGGMVSIHALRERGGREGGAWWVRLRSDQRAASARRYTTHDR